MRDLEHGERRDAGRQPREPHQRQADEEREDAADRAPRARATATLPIVWSRRSGKRSGSTPIFDSSGTVITPAAKAPSATKLICPNESTPELPTKT